MQLRLALVVLVLAGGPALPAAAQSLSPMSNSGLTPSDIKGFRLMIGNPYKTRMIFDVLVLDPSFVSPAPQAVVNDAEIALAPGASRPVIVEFKVLPPYKERTIGVCVRPKGLRGPVQPRVCGLYTGKLIGARG